MSLKSINTERLLLRPPKPEDLEDLFLLRSNLEVNRYIARPIIQVSEDLEPWLEKIMTHNKKEVSCYWVIEDRSTGEILGTICLWNLDEDKMEGELGYELFPKAQGRGLMSEAVKAILKFGRDDISLHKVKAFTHRENMASIKLLLRFGFELLEGAKDEGFPFNIIFSKDLTKPLMS